MVSFILEYQGDIIYLRVGFKVSVTGTNEVFGWDTEKRVKDLHINLIYTNL